jgi:hypothetical protein
MSAFGGPNITYSGLILEMDAGNIKSYPRTGTSWFDKSGNNYNGTLTNGPTFTTSSLGGIVLDGVDDYVSIPNSINTGVGFTGTIELVTNVTGSILFNERTNNKTGEGYFGVESNGTFFVGANSNADPPYTYTITASVLANISGINHYIAAYSYPSSAGTLSGTLGVNGVFNTSSKSVAVNTVNSPPFSNLNIGRYINYVYGSFYTTPGNIYLLRIYNRQLSTTEMLQNYNAVKSRFGL